VSQTAAKKVVLKPVIRHRLAPIPGQRGPGTGYRPEFAGIAKGFCILGGRHLDLASMFGVTENTITNWKKAHAPFREAVEEGSRYADAHVARSFYRRSTGYEITTTKVETRELRDTKGNLTGTVTVTTTAEQHVPADPVGAWRWLQLRQKWYPRPAPITVGDILWAAEAARAEAARRGIDIATALAEIQDEAPSRCPTCGGTFRRGGL
jgi:hypothetical protein